MCDKSTRIWCSRIVLVFTVLGVLSTMIFQVWSYYFSLVDQMDAQTLVRPEVMSFIHICDNVRYVWNAVCTKAKQSEFVCSFENSQGSDVYAAQIGVANVSTTLTSVNIRNLRDCVRITLWELPW